MKIFLVVIGVVVMLLACLAHIKGYSRDHLLSPRKEVTIQRSVTVGVQHVEQETSRLRHLMEPKLHNFFVRFSEVLTHRRVLQFFGGGILLLIVARLSRNRTFSFMSTLEHELTHGVMAVLCGGKFNAMTVTAGNGGYASVTSNIFVNLAPYCLPLFCFALFCVLPLLKEQVRIVWILMAGMAYGNYLRGNFPKIAIQPDIRNSGGKLRVYPLIFTANMLLLMGMLMFLARF